MHIKNIRLNSYKRFSELEVVIPGTPRLVMMCGPNGSGKSSLLEAMKFWQDVHSDDLGRSGEASYHVKGQAPSTQDWSNLVHLEFAEGAVYSSKLLRQMYFRTAYRHEPEFTLNQVGRNPLVLQQQRPGRMIDGDARVSVNYQLLVSQSVDAVFGEADETVKAIEVRERVIGKLRNAVLEVLPELELVGLADPLDGGTFRFAKGVTRNFSYALLSGGEKAVLDLLLDLTVKATALEAPVICIDEPEAHTNPVIQGELLDAMLGLAGAGSQLWLATHSVGMLRRAQEIARATPEDVAFLDFGERDFDQAVQMSPAVLSREFWKRTIASSLGDVAELVAPDRLVLCEGQPSSGDRAEFDARCLRQIFGTSVPDVEFVAVGNDRQVIRDSAGVGQTVGTLVSGTTVIKLVDRDDRSESEVEILESDGVRVLGRRNLEGYLLDESVLYSLCDTLGKPEVKSEVSSARTEALRSAHEGGKPADDLKAAKGDIYNSCRKLLGLRQAGSSADVFMAEQLAPLLKPGMPVYEELYRDIFGEANWGSS
ncbi:MAG TPA: AAA family ATPase [Solirubrobacterales bacterium]|nr:AAA family ATPase [Solirubrobacterales bacterium]